jgi:hypothetical protein
MYPRKRRTRQHVIADQSVNHVERFVIDSGHVVQRVQGDYGYDLILLTFDERGYVEPGSALLQMKATDSLFGTADEFSLDLDVRDVNLWTMEPLPVFVVLFDATKKRAYWLDIQEWFRRNRPRSGAKTVRVWVPRRQRFNRRAVVAMRAAKQALWGQAREATGG